jgi:Leucine-rich repeat (LRR) protein
MNRLNPYANLPPVNLHVVDQPTMSPFVSIPLDVIQIIFSDVKDPRISAVCKLWENINSSFEVHHLILSDYRNESSMKYYIDHLPERMDTNETINTIKYLFNFINKKIHLNGIKEGVEAIKRQEKPKRGPLDLFPITRFIEDTALIDSCTFGGFQICEELNVFVENELEKQLTVTEKATSIREWMKTNPKPLAEIIKIKIESEYVVNDETKLELIVAEIGLFSNLKELYVSSNNLFISSEICKLTNLKRLDTWVENVYFPKSISLLTSMQRLSFSLGFLTHPELLGKFINLKRLELYNIQSLTKLPESIGQLVH